jgi:hypothetical protein
MKGGIVYYRIIPADRDRGFVMLASWIKPVVLRTSSYSHTISVVTQANIDRALEKVRYNLNAESYVDQTDPGIAKRLAKIIAASETPVPAPATE